MLDALSSPWSLFALFGIHLVAFVGLALRRRTLRYLPAIVAFSLLVTLYGLKALQVGGDDLYFGLRLGAGLAFGITLARGVRRWQQRQATAPPPDSLG